MKALKDYKPNPLLINGFFTLIGGLYYKGRHIFKPFRENIDFFLLW